jgi:hypothetical protein
MKALDSYALRGNEEKLPMPRSVCLYPVDRTKFGSVLFVRRKITYHYSRTDVV